MADGGSDTALDRATLRRSLAAPQAVRDSAVQYLSASLMQSPPDRTTRHCAELACWSLLAENSPVNNAEDITADVVTAAGDALIESNACESFLDAVERLDIDQLDESELGTVVALVTHIGTEQPDSATRSIDFLKKLLADLTAPEYALHGLRRIQRTDATRDTDPATAALSVFTDPAAADHWPSALDVISAARDATSGGPDGQTAKRPSNGCVITWPPVLRRRTEMVHRKAISLKRSARSAGGVPVLSRRLRAVSSGRYAGSINPNSGSRSNPESPAGT